MNNNYYSYRTALLFFLSLWVFTPGIADELPKPTGDILLTISGNIKNLNTQNSAQFDLQMLESIDKVHFTTKTPWTDGPTRFTGAQLATLLEYVGAQSTRLRATAMDKYWFDIDTANFPSIPAIVAYKKNDKYMRIRDQGPLWIMFPFDDHPDALNETNKNSCVWQLIEITVL